MMLNVPTAFSHISMMSHIITVHQALRCQIDLSLGRLADKSRLERWLDQVRDDNIVRQLMCGEMLSDEVILGRRNGPRRLRDNDVDAEVFFASQCVAFVVCFVMRNTL